MPKPKPCLTLAPLWYHWSAERRRDFYFRIADEADVAVVYLGEVVCSKREPLFADYEQEVVERLERAGKRVVLSTLALATQRREIDALREKTGRGRVIEANDVAAIHLAKEAGASFVVGPTVNVMNEGTLRALAALGAMRVVFASELGGPSIRLLAAREPKVEKEVQVFGRQPLAVSMRCYHARAYGRDKDHCRFACADDPDGLPVDTIAGQPVLTVSGTQTMTRGTLVLLDEMHAMVGAGVTHFRLAPQECDMVGVARIFVDALEGRIESKKAINILKTKHNIKTRINGFYYGKEGMAFVPPSKTG